MTNDLIDRWVAGDPGAAEEIYRVYYRRAREEYLKGRDRSR
jgi:hypothetical protein